MFDVGFSELVVIGLVALIVIGPERMPTVARTIGALIGRLQRYVNEVKYEIRREMQVDDLKKLHSDVTEQIQSVENTIRDEIRTPEEFARASLTEHSDHPLDLPEHATSPEPKKWLGPH
ncbi:MAG TPA: Sec-independent protein translocase protein TatB [Rhodocyclaceae bacterium]|nr:Sec-independent protein translocase protein TatB [Rhodocyclaceae bacterium]